MFFYFRAEELRIRKYYITKMAKWGEFWYDNYSSSFSHSASPSPFSRHVWFSPAENLTHHRGRKLFIS